MTSEAEGDFSVPAAQRVGELVRTATGLCLSERDLSTLAYCVAERERVRTRAFSGIDSWGALLAEDSAAGQRERERVTRWFSTGETYFFRDQGQMELLATRILPNLIERRSDARSLRIWSAGCSTGEEAYSLAMLVEECAPRLEGWNVLILGTDINSRAIETARRGNYDLWSFRALDGARRERWFSSAPGGAWRIAQQISNRVSFRQGDLLREVFPDKRTELHDIDLILCRNVFIYLSPEAIAHATDKFVATLGEGGYLMTGHSELVGHQNPHLRARVFPGSSVFQKVAQAQANLPVAAPPLRVLEPPARETLAEEFPRVDSPPKHRGYG